MIELEYPKNWNYTRLKHVALINENSLSTSTHSDYILNYLEISNVNNRGIISKNEIRELFFLDAPSRARRIVRNGDTVISSVRPNLQAIAYIKHTLGNLIASTGFYVVTPIQERLDEKYTYYLLISDGSRQHLEAVAKGVGYPAVDDKDFVTLKFSIPSLEEQQRIAAYLDKTCAAIDKGIEAKQKQLEILDALRKSIIHKAVTRGMDDSVELKDSGVEWLGRIPKHWDVVKLKYEVEVKDGTHDTPPYALDAEGNYPFVTSKDIIDNKIDFSATKYISKKYHQSFNRRSDVKKGDIIMPMIGTLGNAAIVKTDKSFSIKNVALFKTSKSSRINTKYLFYFIESEINKRQFFLLSKGGVQSFLSLTILRNLYLIKPHLKEQNKIVAWLDNINRQINDLKENIQKQISTLEQYSKSLIHECVTGKRRSAG